VTTRAGSPKLCAEATGAAGDVQVSERMVGREVYRLRWRK
jgi:hypothetical protein